MNSNKVLLTYAWCRSSYTALRSLRSHGLPVYLADSNVIGMGQSSRLKSGLYSYTSPLISTLNFLRDVNLILEKTGATFLLPGHDETVTLARFRSQLPPNIILPVATYEQLELANDKNRMADLANSLDLPVPNRLNWRNLSDLNDMLSKQTGPWVVKLRKGNGAKGVFYPQDSSGVIDFCTQLIDTYKLSPDRYPIVQQRVEGEGWGVSCLYWEGKRLASFTHRRLREKTSTGGTSTLRVSQHNPCLEDIAHQLLDKMNWHGLAMVEFKYNSQTNKGWFIEVNPRLWGSIHLAVAAGVDFPWLLFVAATQGPEAALKEVQPWNENIIARWYLGDCIASLGQLRRGKISSAIKMLIPGGADTFDDIFWDDPGAIFGQAAYYLNTFLQTGSINPVKDGMLG